MEATRSVGNLQQMALDAMRELSELKFRKFHEVNNMLTQGIIKAFELQPQCYAIREDVNRVFSHLRKKLQDVLHEKLQDCQISAAYSMQLEQQLALKLEGISTSYRTILAVVEDAVQAFNEVVCELISRDEPTEDPLLNAVNIQFSRMTISHTEQRAKKEAQDQKQERERIKNLINSVYCKSSSDAAEKLADNYGFDASKQLDKSCLDEVIENLTQHMRVGFEREAKLSDDQVDTVLHAYKTKFQELKSVSGDTNEVDLLSYHFQAAQSMYDALSRNQNQQFRLRGKLEGQKYGAIADSLTDVKIKKLKRISAILRLEATGKKRIDLVNGTYDKEIQELLDADDLAEEKRRMVELNKVAREVEQAERKARKLQAAKNQGRKAKVISASSPDISSEDASEIISTPVIDPKIQWRTNYLLSLAKRASKPELARVTKRWQSTVQEIREFVDIKSTGEKVKRYEAMSDEQILKWRAFHYLPGTEKIFANKLDEKIYTFISKRGLSMIAELELQNGIRYYGTLIFGINSAGCIYHRCFELMELSNLDKALVLESEKVEDLPESKERWSGSMPYSFDISDKGVIAVKYNQFAHTIRILPLRSDLLVKHYGNYMG